MLKQFLFLLLGLFVAFVSCNSSEKTPESWIPALEGTTFVFLNEPTARAIRAAQAANERDELLLTVDEAPGDAPAEFEVVADRVNLMLLKGDLMPSGAAVTE